VSEGNANKHEKQPAEQVSKVFPATFFGHALRLATPDEFDQHCASAELSVPARVRGTSYRVFPTWNTLTRWFGARIDFCLAQGRQLG
jgi:hypothetical protein